MLPVEVGVILQYKYNCESTVTYCEPTVNFLNLQLIPSQILHDCQWIYMNFLQCTFGGWYITTDGTYSVEFFSFCTVDIFTTFCVVPVPLVAGVL